MHKTAAARGRRACAAATLALALGCGGEEATAPTHTWSAEKTADSSADLDNRPPVIRSVRIDPFEPTLGGKVRAIASAFDPDGDATQIHYRWSIDGNAVPGDQREIALVGASKGSIIEVFATPSDGSLEGETSSAQTQVVDRPPVVTGVGLSPAPKVAPGSPIKAVAQAHDPDGDLVRFEYAWLVNGEPAAARGDLFSTEGLHHGDRVQILVVATDGANRSAPMKSIEVTVGSAHPEIVSKPPGMDSSGVFRYAVVAKDPDGDRRLRYRLGEAPDGMAIDAIYGEILWKPRQDQTGEHPVAIVVTDSTGLETTQKFKITVRVADAAPAAPQPSGGRR